jgi:hypothetical protein
MYQLTLLLTAIFAFNVATIAEKIPDNPNPDSRITYKTLEELELEDILFNTADNLDVENLDTVSIEVLDIEEDAEINFDTKAHLPVNFNALQGMHDLNWNTIELVELEEEANLNFDTKAYLPSDFSAYNIDWSTVNLVELEEDVELNFNTKAYLPKAFNPYKGMDCEKGEVVCLY